MADCFVFMVNLGEVWNVHLKQSVHLKQNVITVHCILKCDVIVCDVWNVHLEQNVITV